MRLKPFILTVNMSSRFLGWLPQHTIRCEMVWARFIIINNIVRDFPSSHYASLNPVGKKNRSWANARYIRTRCGCMMNLYASLDHPSVGRIGHGDSGIPKYAAYDWVPLFLRGFIHTLLSICSRLSGAFLPTSKRSIPENTSGWEHLFTTRVGSP